MVKEINKVYLFKFFYTIIMFFGVALLPFFMSSYDNDYKKILDDYNDKVAFAVSEEFNFTKDEKNELLDLLAEVKEAGIKFHYNNIITVMIVIIFLSIFNYLYIIGGLKYKLLNNSTSMQLNKRILSLISIVQILYFVGLILFTDKEYIGINSWTLIFVNLIIVIFVVVIALQIQYWIKLKNESHHD